MSHDGLQPIAPAVAAPPLLTDRSNRIDAPIVAAAQTGWTGLNVARLTDVSGDIRSYIVARQTLVHTREGSADHVLHLDGRTHTGETLPNSVMTLPQGSESASRWANRGLHQVFHVVEFDAGLFDLYVPELPGQALRRGHLVADGFAERRTIAGLIELLAGEIDPAQRRGRLWAETIIRLLAIEIAATVWSDPQRVAERDTPPDRRVARALDYIEAHFVEDIALVDIAAAAGLSPSPLIAAFRQATGQTPYAWVVARRLRAAVALLREGTMPIAQIAVVTGFYDQAHLTRVCRARLGTTPTAIRRGQ